MNSCCKNTIPLVCLFSTLHLACVVDGPMPGDDVGSRRQPILFGADSEGSSLKWNEVSWNEVSWNEVSWNEVSWNEVSWNELSTGQQSWYDLRADTSLVGAPLDEAGSNADFTLALTDPHVRYLFKYIISCALPYEAEVTYEDDNSDEWTFTGLHGLAPQWETEDECDTSCQRWVSACVYGRLNYYGERNVLSWRSGENIPDNTHIAGMEDPSADEEASFNLNEGAVWGNLFLEYPEIWVCRGTDTVVGLSIVGIDLSIYEDVPMGAIRMCAEDQTCLANVYAGPCWNDANKVCAERRTDNDAYYECAASGGSPYNEVITINRADFGFHADFVPGAGLPAALSDCAAVAEADSSTCDEDWDQDCIDDYSMEGADVGGCNESNRLLFPVDHSPLETGHPLDRHRSTCAAYTCAVDGDCCTGLVGGSWDSSCADLAEELCQ